MKIRVNEDLCMGCGMCASLCQDVFEINEETGRSTVIMNEITDEVKEEVLDAMDGCPTSAIEEVIEDEIKEAA